MSSSQPRPALGATPGKLALIVILSIVMVGVIASNWPSAAAPPVGETAADQPPVATATTEEQAQSQPAGATGPFGDFADDQHWPALPIKEVTAFDPLAASEWAKPPALTAAGGTPAQNEQQIQELLAAQNAIIFVAGERRIARIGDKEYRVGDVIGRYTISDITAKGVVLSEANNQ